MPKLRMNSGLPGSGKTTYAREMVDQGWGRVNRDDLRAMIFNGKWSGKREQIIVAVEKAIAEVLLDNDVSVIVDDTNLTQKHRDLWSGFARLRGTAFDVHKMDTPLAECIRRDSEREKPIGEAIIYRMALTAGLIDFGPRPIVIVDIDGTIADGKHRNHLVETQGQKKDWDAYYALLATDEPIRHIIRWVNALAEDHTIVIVSGRPDTYQIQTLNWLRYIARIKFDYIFMRPGNEKKPDYEVKADILSKLPKEQIDFVLDDRPSVIEKCWRDNGVRVFPVKGACDAF